MAGSSDCLAAKPLTREKVKALRTNPPVEPAKTPDADVVPSVSSQWLCVAERLSSLPGLSAKVDSLPGGAIELRLVASDEVALHALIEKLGMDAEAESPFSG